MRKNRDPRQENLPGIAVLEPPRICSLCCKMVPDFSANSALLDSPFPAKFRPCSIGGKMKFLCSTLLALAALSFVSAASADTLTLKNGDHLTGTVVDSDGKQLTLKTDYAGDVKIQMSAISAITAAKAALRGYAGEEDRQRKRFLRGFQPRRPHREFRRRHRPHDRDYHHPFRGRRASIRKGPASGPSPGLERWRHCRLRFGPRQQRHHQFQHRSYRRPQNALR